MCFYSSSSETECVLAALMLKCVFVCERVCVCACMHHVCMTMWMFHQTQCLHIFGLLLSILSRFPFFMNCFLSVWTAGRRKQQVRRSWSTSCRHRWPKYRTGAALRNRLVTRVRHADQRPNISISPSPLMTVVIVSCSIVSQLSSWPMWSLFSPAWGVYHSPCFKGS